MAVAHGGLRQPRRGARGGPRQGPGRLPSCDAHRDGRPAARRRREARVRAGQGRRGGGRGGRADPRRRHRDRGHRVRGRVRDHRRVRPGRARVRRRPQRGTGGTRVLSDRIVVEITQEPGQELPRPDDRARGGRRAAQDPERDRARHPPRGPHDRVPGGGGQPAPVRRVRVHRGVDRHADRAAGLADPHHDRRAAVGDRHRRDGPPGAPQRAGAVRARGRGLRRRRRAAAGQDRHDHARQPRGHRADPDAGRDRGRARRGGSVRLPGRRDARGSLDRGAGQAVRHPRARAGPAHHPLRALQRPDAHERRGSRRLEPAQGRRRRRRRLHRGPGGPGAARARRPSSTASAARAAPRWPSRATARCWASSTSRTSSRRGCRARFDAAAQHGHPHRHGHRRQPPDRRQDRRGGAGWTTSCPRPPPSRSWS